MIRPEPIWVPLLALAILGGCVAVAPYPADWSARDTGDAWCQAPQGRFAVTAVTSTLEDESAPRLTELFFGSLLNGFDVTHLVVDSPSPGMMRVRPWVGTVALNEERLLEPARKSCRPDRWQVTEGWGWDGFMAVGGLVWTGGIVLPAGSKQIFTLNRTAEGGLAVRFEARTAGTLFLFFPFRSRDVDAWFLFPVAAEPLDG